MSINLPPEFNIIINNYVDYSDNPIFYNTEIRKALDSFSTFATTNSDLYFFYNYTNHGIDHVQKVITTSADLIAKNTFQFLSPKDVFVLIGAILHHDLGMLTSYDCFKAMVEDGYYDDLLNESKLFPKDRLSWKDAWKKFVFDLGKKPIEEIIDGKVEYINDDIFIDTETKSIRLPSKERITPKHRRAIGEFIRRHHPRIAHEFAMKGIFVLKENTATFFKIITDNIPNYQVLNQIIGIVARSHGLPIVDTFPYLKAIFGDVAFKAPLDIKALFLMALLRVGDYFQVSFDRTFTNKLISIRNITNDFSINEHKLHEQIAGVHAIENVDELINIHASPESSYFYEKLDKLIQSIQKELDESWTILSEHYGRGHHFRLKYRKITSNIYNNDFKENLPFHHKPLKYTIDANVLQHFIEPLYGNKPEYGIRELLQNSIDACNERIFVEKEEYCPRVNIHLNEEQKRITFKDNGMGMTLNDIRSFFLKAGATKKVAVENTNQNIGRFGIGVLAGFILGNDMEVKTKHNDEIGYSFKLNSKSNFENIEIKKIYQSMEQGTEIVVSVKPDFDSLFSGESNIKNLFQWYYFQTPKIYLEDKLLNEPQICIDSNDFWKDDTFEFESKKGYSIKASHSVHSEGILLCVNGFKIPIKKGIIFPVETDYKDIRFPQFVCVKDKNALFPLKLNRNAIDLAQIDYDEFAENCYKTQIALLIKTQIPNPYNHNYLFGNFNTSFSNKIKNGTPNECKFVYTPTGAYLYDSLLLKDIPIPSTNDYYVIGNKSKSGLPISFMGGTIFQSEDLYNKATGKSYQKMVVEFSYLEYVNSPNNEDKFTYTMVKIIVPKDIVANDIPIRCSGRKIHCIVDKVTSFHEDIDTLEIQKNNDFLGLTYIIKDFVKKSYDDREGEKGDYSQYATNFFPNGIIKLEIASVNKNVFKTVLCANAPDNGFEEGGFPEIIKGYDKDNFLIRYKS